MKQLFHRKLTLFCFGTLLVISHASLAQMDHGNMQMQGGNPPADARDPHAYSDGYTRSEGPYALPSAGKLKLADEHSFWAVMGNRVEYQDDSESTVYDLQGWFGGTYDRLVIKAEGDIKNGSLEESSTDVLWGHAFNAYFDSQLGLRADTHEEGEDRQWLALGFQGLAPYWFEVDVTAYLGDEGRTALSAEAEYEMLITQRLILQPRAEINLLGKEDLVNGLGSGLNDLALGLRLRYEFTRQFAPYIGVEWQSAFGETANLREAAGEEKSNTQVLAGLRFWF